MCHKCGTERMVEPPRDAKDLLTEWQERQKKRNCFGNYVNGNHSCFECNIRSPCYLKTNNTDFTPGIDFISDHMR